MQAHKSKNILLIISSIYLIFTALVSLGFIVSIVIKIQSLDIIASLSLLIALSIVLLTLGVNGDILLNRSILKRKNVLFNLVICLIQSISIFSEGFCYKYTQGIEWVGFIHFDKNTNNFDSGTFLSKLIFEFVFNFKKANGTMLGTNFITLLLAIFFIFLLSGIKKPDVVS